MVRTQYVPNSAVPIDVTEVIRNRHGHVVSAIGSYSLKVPFPHMRFGQNIEFELKIKLSLEAGEYSFNVGLSHPPHEGIVGVGELIFESSQIVPVSVTRDYLKEIPAFYGMVGLQASATIEALHLSDGQSS